MKQVKLVTVTRKDLEAGHQLAQSIHSATTFAHQYPNQFLDWISTSNYVVSLSIDNEENLKDLYNKLQYYGADVVAFYEPDIGNQMTSICFYGTPDMQRHTRKLKLALQN